MGSLSIPSSLQDLSLCPITHEIIKLPFTCGDGDLDDFYKNDAILYKEQLLAKTYIFYTPEKKIISYISLLNDKISSKNESVSNNAFKKIKKRFANRKHFSSYPAIKIGRFAVSNNYQEKGVGRSIINYILYSIVKNEKNDGACRFITVDAYQKAIGFYEKCGFLPLCDNLSKGILPMFYDLKQIENSLA